MAENQENSTSKQEEQPVLHIKQSEYAKAYLNDWIQKMVMFKNQVKYLEQEAQRNADLKRHDMWKSIDVQIRKRKEELADVKNAVKAAKQTLDDTLELEKQGKWFD